MKIAHIILVHKNPAQIIRMLKRLSGAGVDCWIHVDRKCKTIDSKDLLQLKNVHIVQPVIEVTWGCFNTVQAMLNSMKAVMSANKRYDYINFLSGQDYPLQPPDIFLNYLNEHKGYEFIGNRPYEESKQNIARFRRFHFNRYSFPENSIFERVINFSLPERKFPYPYQIRKGPQWMALTAAAVSYILKFVLDNPGYVDYFKWVHIPDEFFFQTILYNSPFKSTMKNQIFHYIDWSENKRHPKIFTMKDRKNLLTSTLFFARKFDTLIDSSILDALDERIFAGSF